MEHKNQIVRYDDLFEYTGIESKTDKGKKHALQTHIKALKDRIPDLPILLVERQGYMWKE